MRRLNGLDDGFLHLESPTAPMNSMAIGVLVPATGADGRPQPLTMDDLRRHMADRLGDMPSLRWRLTPVPGRLNHPNVIEDPDFDLDYHLRHAVVAAPGGPVELDRLVAHLAEQHMDRRHPLWQLTLVDGLANGRQAAVYRVQHALQDGTAAYTSFSLVFSGRERRPAVRSEAWQPEPVPSRSRLVAGAVRDLAATWAGLPALAVRTVKGMQALKAHQATAAVKPPQFVVDTPPTSLNDAFTRAHSYARLSLPLADMKRVKDAAGVSLNDVLLAVVAAGLRGHLLARDGLPGRPLTASVPVGFEPADAPPRQYGNRFTNITTTLATDVDDPWERLHVISEVTTEAKACLDLSGPEMMAEWLDAVPPAIAEPGIHSLQRKREADRSEAEQSVVVSNLKGPSEPWHLDTALVESLHIQGPPSNGIGPNVMVWSYGDQMLIGLLCFADAVADPHELAAGIAAGLAELVAGAEAHLASGQPAGLSA